MLYILSFATCWCPHQTQFVRQEHPVDIHEISDDSDGERLDRTFHSQLTQLATRALAHIWRYICTLTLKSTASGKTIRLIFKTFQTSLMEKGWTSHSVYVACYTHSTCFFLTGVGIHLCSNRQMPEYQTGRSKPKLRIVDKFPRTVWQSICIFFYTNPCHQARRSNWTSRRWRKARHTHTTHTCLLHEHFSGRTIYQRLVIVSHMLSLFINVSL